MYLWNYRENLNMNYSLDGVKGLLLILSRIIVVCLLYFKYVNSKNTDLLFIY
jgi:hypothetical protein